LKININEKDKIVTLWFNSQEYPKDKFPNNIEKEIEQYRQKKYKICMFESGKEDIKKNLLNLIINNAY